VRFLVDAQLPPGLAIALRELGHETEHVFEIGLVSASDARIWHHATERSATIITKDSDFAFRRRMSETGPAVVWLRFGNTTSRALVENLLPFLPEILTAIEAGESLIEVR
jgi:predicted nuclease of predicted toxin-antitoxin system